MTKPVFKITTPEGHEYRIHADGRVEGFPEHSIIINRIPVHVAEKIGAYLAEKHLETEGQH